MHLVQYASGYECSGLPVFLQHNGVTLAVRHSCKGRKYVTGLYSVVRPLIETRLCV